MKQILNYIMNGAATNRYHTVDLIKPETVGHHSHGVAMLCLAIDPIASRQLLVAALLHDLPEHVYGDVPSPAKRELKIREELEELEMQSLFDAGLPMPELNDHDARVLKLADNVHGALKCIREMRMGNQLVLPVLERYMSYIGEIEFPTVQAHEIYESLNAMVGK